MRRNVCALMLATAFTATLWSAPFLRTGDNSEIFLTARLGARMDDNIFLTAQDETDDIILEFSPGLEWSFGQGALTTGLLTLRQNFVHYVDHDDFNEELAVAGFRGTYDDEKLRLTLNAGYEELYQNTRDIRGPFLVRRDAATAVVGAEVAVTQKTAVGAGVAYDTVDYKRAGYADLKTFSVPVDYFYSVSEKADVSVGFRYRDTDVSLFGQSAKDYYYRAGARGEFTPKLTGQFNVGLNERRLDNGRDESSVGIDSTFTYLASEKTTVRLGLANDYATSAEGESQENFVVSVTATNNLSAEWQISAGAAFYQVEYFGGRSDDFVDAQVAAAYVINTYLRIRASYEHRLNESNVPAAEFTNNLISLALEARY